MQFWQKLRGNPSSSVRQVEISHSRSPRESLVQGADRDALGPDGILVNRLGDRVPRLKLWYRSRLQCDFNTMKALAMDIVSPWPINWWPEHWLSLDLGPLESWTSDWSTDAHLDNVVEYYDRYRQHSDIVDTFSYWRKVSLDIIRSVNAVVNNKDRNSKFTP